MEFSLGSTQLFFCFVFLTCMEYIPLERRTDYCLSLLEYLVIRTLLENINQWAPLLQVQGHLKGPQYNFSPVFNFFNPRLAKKHAHCGYVMMQAIITCVLPIMYIFLPLCKRMTVKIIKFVRLI